MRKVQCIPFLTALMLAGCSNEIQNSHSAMQDIAKPGVTDGENVLFWHDQGKIFRGHCLPQKPLTKGNCQTGVVSQAKKDVDTKAQGLGLEKVSAWKAKIVAEIKNLKAQDPTVQSLTAQMNSLNAEKAKLATESAALKKSLATNKSDQEKVDEQTAYVAEQLAAVNKALTANPSSEELLQLKASLLTERDALKAKNENLKSDKAAFEGRLASTEKSAALASSKAEALYKELTAFTADLAVTSESLRNLYKSLKGEEEVSASLPAAFAMIETTDLTFRSTLLKPSEVEALNLIGEALGASSLLRPGVSAINSGYNYCRQKISPATVNGDKASFKVDFLSPCSSGVSFSCTKNECLDTQGYYKLTVIASEQYSFSSRNGANSAVFGWVSENP